MTSINMGTLRFCKSLRYLDSKYRSKSLKSTIKGDGGEPTGRASRRKGRSDCYTSVPHVAGAEGDECPCEPTASDKDELGSIAMRIVLKGKTDDGGN